MKRIFRHLKNQFRRIRRFGRGASENKNPEPSPIATPPAAAPPPPREKPDRWDPSKHQPEPKEGFLRFCDFDLPHDLLRAIHDLGFRYCTPIQAQMLPHTLAGRDAAGRAQTGTGKTAAFLITALTRLRAREPGDANRPGAPRVLVLAPTRELAIQIEQEARELGRHGVCRSLAVFGGMDYGKQEDLLRRAPVDILVATPGRLLDFMRRRVVNLGRVEILVIDEADRMLDMGFIPDVRRIVHSTPEPGRRQTLLLSATLTPDVLRLASQWTRDPVMIEIEPEQVAVRSVEQILYIVTAAEKFPILYNMIRQNPDKTFLVFGNRRDETKDLLERLRDHDITCALLSGMVDQSQRLKTLEAFRAGKIKVVVATDVAGRGIHVENVGYVVNYNLPMDPEDYVHRIGRTGRAGATGTSISFADEEDAFVIPDIEKYLGHELKCSYPDESLLTPPPPPTRPPRRPEKSGRGDRRGPRRGGRPGVGRGGPRRGGKRPPRRSR